MHLSFIKSQGHGLIMRVVFYHGVGSQVFMDSFFVTGVTPKAIMSQNEEAREKLFFITFFRYDQKSGSAPLLCTPFVLRTLVDSELRWRRNWTFDGPALFYAPLYPKSQMSFAPLGSRRSRGSREVKRTHPLWYGNQPKGKYGTDYLDDQDQE